MRIWAPEDGGNIEIVSAGETVELAIRHDAGAPEYMQWFHFRVDGMRGIPLDFRIINAGECTYPDAWEGYDVCASHDLIHWFRVRTTYEDGVLRFRHAPKSNTIHFGYFAPYEVERQDALLARVALAPDARVQTVGKSVQGRGVELITVGEPSAERANIWLCARQHPGETMAQWLADGLIERLLQGGPLIDNLLERAVFHIVPTMNPDGGVLGHLRSNAAGVNLNRAWQEPDADESPEVLGVRDAMESMGVDVFLDVHGDERNPYCFLAGSEGNPSYDDGIRSLENVFEQALLAVNADFQDEYGYERDEPGGGDLTTAGNWVGERFGCLSYTLEMPFKDALNHPDPAHGWTPQRAQKLGSDVLTAVDAVLDELE